MTKILATITAGVIALMATSNTADARSRISIGSTTIYVSGHNSYGIPIYTKRVVRGFDRYRRPLYNYYRMPANYRPRSIARGRGRIVNRATASNSRRGLTQNRSNNRARNRR